MDELKTCPICGSKLTIHGPEDWKPTFYDPDSGGDPYNAVCDCGFQFSIGYCEYDEFIKALNRRPAPENKPLTLEQLRQMDGEPIWFDWNDIGWAKVVMIDGHPRIAAVVNHGAFGYQCHLYTPTDIDGNSHAYARKPEREEK